MVRTPPGLFYLWSPWPCSWLYHTSGNRENQTQSLLPFPLFFKKKGAINTDTFTKGIAIKKEWPCMPLPIYGQDNTGTFLLMVTMTLLMTLPHFRKITLSRPSQAITWPNFKTINLTWPSQTWLGHAPQQSINMTKSSHDLATLSSNQSNMTKSSRYSATHPSINSTTT